MDTIHIDSGKTLMVAHRGASRLEKENSVAAFIAAGNRSYFGIETDVHRTVDGQFIIIHDDNTKRVALDNISVEESTYDTLRSVQLCDIDGKKGRSDLRLPNLMEYIRLCKKYEKVGVLEIKNRMETEDLARIVEMIRGEDYLEQIIFISFNLDNVKDLRAMLPQQRIQFLISSFPDDLIDTLKTNKLDLDIQYACLTKERIDLLHANGIVVNCWTVDDPDAARQLVEWGVDQITSNALE